MKRGRETEEWWRVLLTGKNLKIPIRQVRLVFRLIPRGPRCKFCNAPYEGLGGPLMRVIGRGLSRLTLQFCRTCQDLASKHIGGAEVEVSLVFADVHGSTSLAEKLSPSEFSRLIGRFFAVSTEALLRTNAWVDRLVGDQVIGMYLPGFAGPEHARIAIRAAQNLLDATGHDDLSGPWIPVGVGVHTDTAFVGAVGSQGRATYITTLGDAPNVASRLASAAGPGEILISEACFLAAGLTESGLDVRQLELKGKREPVKIYALRDYSLNF